MEPELFDQSSGRGPDVERLGLLIAAHDRELRRVATAISGDPARAAAAVAATWNAARRRRRSFASGAAARAWLLERVAREADRRVRPSWLAPLTARLPLRRRMRPAEVEPVRDPALATALAQLTAEDRHMLALHHGAGLTSEEIAGQLQLTGAGIRTHLADLHRQLREALAIASQDETGRPLTDREVESRIAGRLVAHLDRGAASPDGQPLPEIRAPVSVRLPSLPDPRRHPALTAGLVIVLVLVIAVPVSLRLAGVARETVTPTPVPGTLVPLAGWSETTVDLHGPGVVLAWSPDGRRVAVRVGDGSIAIFDRTGRLVRGFPGTDVAWIDDERLAVLSANASQAGFSGLGMDSSVSIRQLDSQDDLLLTTPAPPVRLVGGGGLAIELSVQNVPAAVVLIQHAFVTLGPAGLSSPITGVPLAWTPDGRHLAYIRQATQYGPNLYDGMVSILDAATGDTRDTGQYVRQIASTAFDPSGRWLLAGATSARTPDGSELALLDTRDETLEHASIPASGTVTAWSADSSLLVGQGITLLRWRPGDTPVALRWPSRDTSRAVGMAAFGNRVVVGLQAGPKVASIVAGTVPEVVALPGSATGPVAVSPDGGRLAYTRQPDQGRILVLASLPASAASSTSHASPAPGDSAQPSPSPRPTPSLGGIPLLPLEDALKTTLAPDAQQYPFAMWGTHLYLLSGFDTRQVELSVLDLRTQALWITNLLPGGLLPGEQIGALQIDGDHLVLEAYRRLGPPSDQAVQCPIEERQPVAWRLLTAPLDANGRPPDTFTVLDSGTASRGRTYTANTGPHCPVTGPPAIATGNGRIAYAVEAPTTANPWASRIIVRNLAGGAVVESQPTADPVDWIGFGDDMLAWIETPDVTAPRPGLPRLRVQLPFGTKARTVTLPTGQAAPQSSFIVTGDLLAYAIMDYASVDPISAWRLDPSTGATERISVPPPYQGCTPVAGTTGALFLDCWGTQHAMLVWRGASGLAVLDAGDASFLPATGGGWMLLFSAVTGSSGTDVLAFPLSDVLR